MKTFRCVCSWSGFWPNVVKTERVEDGITVIRYIAFCPDCDHEFTFEQHAEK